MFIISSPSRCQRCLPELPQPSSSMGTDPETRFCISGETFDDMLDKCKSAAVDHNLSIAHLDLKGLDQETVSQRAEKICSEMCSHTSTNGLFMVILAGSREVNASAGLKIIPPPT